ncbi:MAG: hypothetical protein R6U88_01160 [Candidatus Bipolaricaulota bacterium]
MRWILAALGTVLLQAPGLAQNENDVEGMARRALAFFHTAAEWIGEGLVRLVDVILPGTPPPDIASPMGYLGLLTLILFLFGIVAAARKVIWILVAAGWVLMVLRIILHAVGTI